MYNLQSLDIDPPIMIMVCVNKDKKTKRQKDKDKMDSLILEQGGQRPQQFLYNIKLK